LRLKRNPKRV